MKTMPAIPLRTSTRTLLPRPPTTMYMYVQPPLNMTVCSDHQFFNEQLIFGLLDHLRPTAEGLDQHPAWYPISVFPGLSSILERLVVRTFVYPSFWINPIAKFIKDQCAFRGTGSTTAAHVDLLQKLPGLLRENEYGGLFQGLRLCEASAFNAKDEPP